MTNHIILSAFGTTTRAKDSYNYLEKRIAPHFPDCALHWAFSSPTVRQRSTQAEAGSYPSLADIVNSIRDPGRIVIQSLHVLAGYEFDRIQAESIELPFPVSIGQPLLSEDEDFTRVTRALEALVDRSGHEAVLILGHGTDHPCRSSYARLQEELHTRIGSQVYFTTIEKADEPAETTVRKIARAGHTQIFCIPFLMVAGMHFFRDINGDHATSWKNLLDRYQVSLDLHNQGLAYLNGVDEIFCDHIRAALNQPGD